MRRGTFSVGLDLCSRSVTAFAHGIDITIGLPLGRSDQRHPRVAQRLEKGRVPATNSTRRRSTNWKLEAAGACKPKQLNGLCVSRQKLATVELQPLFSQPDVIDDLRRLNAAVSLSLMDLSPGRAGVVQRLNEAGIPVTAWIALPKEEGYYLNAANAGEAVARFAAFETWTSEYGLRWAGVGLDIEPNLQEFGAVRRPLAAPGGGGGSEMLRYCEREACPKCLCGIHQTDSKRWLPCGDLPVPVHCGRA